MNYELLFDLIVSRNKLSLKMLGMVSEISKNVRAVIKKALIMVVMNKFDNNVDMNELIKALEQYTGLARLELKHYEIGTAEAKTLASVLSQCTALSALNLGCNSLGPYGMQSLAKVLPLCTALTGLGLYNNRIGPIGAVSIAKVLSQCNLTVLDLHYNRIRSEGAGRLIRVISLCLRPLTINLSYNMIGKKIIIAFEKLESKNFKFICDEDEEIAIEFD